MIKQFDSLDDAEKPKIEDVLYTAAKFGLNYIPVAGPFLSELMGYMFANPIEQRKNTLLKDLNLVLENLVENGSINYDSLKDDKEFLNVVLNAIPMALRSFEDEKRTAFKNAIINTALNRNPNETETQVFLHHLERMTLLHLQLLHYCQEPRGWFTARQLEIPTGHMSSISSTLKKGFTELQDKSELLEIIWNDLYSSKLISTSTTSGSMTHDGTLAPMTSSFGNKFLAFITYNNE